MFCLPVQSRWRLLFYSILEVAVCFTSKRLSQITKKLSHVVQAVFSHHFSGSDFAAYFSRIFFAYSKTGNSRLIKSRPHFVEEHFLYSSTA